MVRNFDIALPASNPQLLECFRTRNHADSAANLGLLVAWSGEYPGKWLTHCTELWRLTQDPDLHHTIQAVVDELAACQASDGYLAPWPDSQRWSREHWDTWGHYHIMIGCLLWADATQDSTALMVASKIADVVCAHFTTAQKLYDQGGLEQNMAILHSVARLFTRTRQPKLLAFCNIVLRELQMPPAGDYMRNALKGNEFFQGSQRRWEALCGILGFAELAHATSNNDCLAAFQQIWWSLCKFERKNHGGIMSDEEAAGSPYAAGSVETCCTVTWGAMCVEMLKLSGNSIAVDELELSMYNSGMFLLSPSGRWCVYDSRGAIPGTGTRASTTLEGTRRQNKPAASELSCCATNGPRIVGLPADWAVMALSDGKSGFAINLFAAGTVVVPFSPPATGHLQIIQRTTYPRDGTVSITLQQLLDEEPCHTVSNTFELWIRIPCWSEKTFVSLNNSAAVLPPPLPGQYLKLPSTAGGTPLRSIKLQLDFRLRCWLLPAPHPGVGPAAEHETHSSRYVEPPQPLPNPMWSSAWGTRNAKTFAAGGGEVVSVSGTTAIGAGPTSGCAWIGGCRWTATAGPAHEMIPFSFGRGGSPGFSRALAVSRTNASYFGYEGASPVHRDLSQIVSQQHAETWELAMSDGNWHHICVTDDGKQVSLLLDGHLIGGGTHPSPPRTTAGAVVGGWDIKGNRDFCGTLVSVQLYTACLTSAQVVSLMQQTKPSFAPPSMPNLGCLYRGPVLLGFDPAYNLTWYALTLLQYATLYIYFAFMSFIHNIYLMTCCLECTCSKDPPVLDPIKLTTVTKVVSTNLRFIEPSLTLETLTAAGNKVRLCDYGSVGLTGTTFTTWFELKVPSGFTLPKSAPFTRTNTSRTFFLDSHVASEPRVTTVAKSLAVKISIKRKTHSMEESNEARRFQVKQPNGFDEFVRSLCFVLTNTNLLALRDLEFHVRRNDISAPKWRQLNHDTWSDATLEFTNNGVCRARCTIDDACCGVCR